MQVRPCRGISSVQLFPAALPNLSDSWQRPLASAGLPDAQRRRRANPANHEMLSRLDGAVGDGDHGTTILRTMEAVAKTVAEHTGGRSQAILLRSRLGRDVVRRRLHRAAARLLLHGHERGGGRQDRTRLRRPWWPCSKAGIAKLHKQSRAQVGDKTMMDAFLPALAALKSRRSRRAASKPRCSRPPKPPPRAPRPPRPCAPSSAAPATWATASSATRIPGAVSVSLLFKGFSEGV